MFTKTVIFKKLKTQPTSAVNKNTWKHHVADIRHKAIESTPGFINNWLDYAKHFIFEHAGQLQNEFYDKKHTLSMDGCSLYLFRKKLNVIFFMTMVVGMSTNLMKQ